MFVFCKQGTLGEMEMASCHCYLFQMLCSTMMMVKSAFVLPCLLLRKLLPKLVMRIFLAKFDLNTIKHRHLGLALILMFEADPNYASIV